MKKHKLLTMMGAALMLAAASCSSNDVTLTEGETSSNEVSATFAIATPESFSTRAAGDGTTVDRVRCAVFDQAGNVIPALTRDATISGKQATFSTSLVKGRQYRVVFFAYKNGSNVYDLSNMKAIKMQDTPQANKEDYDCFTNVVDISASETRSAVTKQVKLYRPVAQINILTTDEDISAAHAAGIDLAKSKLRLAGSIYQSFNAYGETPAVGETPFTGETKGSGKVTDLYAKGQTTQGTAVFTMTDLYKEAGNLTTYTINDVTYKRIGLAYAFVGNYGTKNITDIDFTWQTAGGTTNDPATHFGNIPVQRNYRTNIYGNILTSPAEFNISIEEAFDEPDYNVMAWDGKTVKEITPSTTDANLYEVNTPEQLAWIAQQVNSNRNSFSGKTVKLMADIDLGNKAWNPIGQTGGYNVNGTYFSGTFDGNGHTISNLNVNVWASDGVGANYASGLFGFIDAAGATIKDLTIDYATVDGRHWCGVIAGYMSNQGTISNCTVRNANVVCSYANDDAGGDKAGSIIGYSNTKIENCTAVDCTVRAVRDAGQIVGANQEANVTGCAATNVIVTAIEGQSRSGQNITNDIIGRKI